VRHGDVENQAARGGGIVLAEKFLRLSKGPDLPSRGAQQPRQRPEDAGIVVDQEYRAA
jgi:hypothetical protein